MDAQPLGGLLRYFDSVPDPRSSNTSYSLAQLLTLTLMGVLCRCEDYQDIADWVHLRRDWLDDLLGLPLGRTPCAKTFERIFSRLEPRPLLDCFIKLTDALAERHEGRLVALDGKTLRGSFDHAHRTLPIHLVHAWDQTNGLLLGQIAVDQKSNEITAVPALLELLDLEGAVVSLDAMHGLPQTARAILGRKADYLLAIKNDRRRFTQDLKVYFDDATAMQAPELQRFLHEPDNGHGRLDEREVWCSGEVGWLTKRHPEWPELRGIVCVEGRRTDFATGKTSVHRRYYATSLDPREVGAAAVGSYVRGHWSVENQLHWSLDVTYSDDRRRVRKGHGAENLALVVRHAHGLLGRSTPEASTLAKAARMSRKRRQLQCGLSNDYLLKTLRGGDMG